MDEQLSSAEFVLDVLICEAEHVDEHNDVMIVDHEIFKLELNLSKIDDIIVWRG